MADNNPIPAEPIGAEAAIFWHLERIDYHANQEAMAEAMDYIESSRWHCAQMDAHVARLAILEAEFPEMARAARASLQAFTWRPSMPTNPIPAALHEGDAIPGTCPAEHGGKMIDCAAYPACACDYQAKRTILDDIADYVRGSPADLGAISKAINMTPSNAFWAVLAAEEGGKIRRARYGLYEACN